MINNKLGNSFATPIIVVGVFFTLIGIMSILIQPIVGLIILLIACFMWSNSYGFQIDFEKKRFREYGSIYGIKSGEWKALNKVFYLCVLKSRMGTTVYSRSNRATTSIEDKYDVILLNKTHRKRYIVQKFNSKEKAIKYAESLSVKIDKPIVKFNPLISEKTKSKRR